ncbi:MAG TPA: hypothetical protein VHC69_22170 [Polyangiaceae bacterium]|nr:hypothetical protein [Polyangiaceae bacterium]
MVDELDEDEDEDAVAVDENDPLTRLLLPIEKFLPSIRATAGPQPPKPPLRAARHSERERW